LSEKDGSKNDGGKLVEKFVRKKTRKT